MVDVFILKLCTPPNKNTVILEWSNRSDFYCWERVKTQSNDVLSLIHRSYYHIIWYYIFLYCFQIRETKGSALRTNGSNAEETCVEAVKKGKRYRKSIQKSERMDKKFIMNYTSGDMWAVAFRREKLTEGKQNSSFWKLFRRFFVFSTSSICFVQVLPTLRARLVGKRANSSGKSLFSGGVLTRRKTKCWGAKSLTK